MTALPKSKGRATLSRTLFVCGLLLAALAIVFLIASVIGSQRLPLAASLCALTGRSNCGLSPEQQAILFDLRLPRNLLAGAVGMCLGAAGAGFPGLLTKSLGGAYLLGGLKRAGV